MSMLPVIRRVMAILIVAGAVAVSLRAHEEGFPEQTLKMVFPEATGFTPRTKTFTADQVQKIQESSRSKLQKEDNPLTYYVALGKSADGSGVLGTVVMVDAEGAKGGLDLAVGVKRDGSIARVVVTQNKDEAALGVPAFLDQLRGKSMQSRLIAGQDIRYSGSARSADGVLSAVRRALYLMAEVQGKRAA